MTKEKNLNDKKIWIHPYNYFRYNDVKEFIKKFQDAMRDIRPNDNLESYTFRLRKNFYKIFGEELVK